MNASNSAFAIGATLALAAFTLACRPSDRGTHPDDMSAAQHEAHAQEEDRIAKEHEALAEGETPPVSAGCTSSGFDVCWTSPTSDQHEEMAEQHRALGARHRAASSALGDAEAHACIGIGEAERTTSPFSHRADLEPTATKGLERSLPNGDGNAYVVKSGARVVFRAVPGMTGEWLQRLVDCHIARNAAIGHVEASRQMPACPLTLAGIHARVTSVSNGFAVDITSDDEATAAEILRRARALGGNTK